ncbi:MAG: hypothetical protein R3B57_13635 [Phycisphaerales bacterium]
MESATSPTTHQSFEADCQECVGALRAALIRLYADLDLDPESPQDVSRRFKLNKTLTWKLSKVIASHDNLAALAHVPGAGAMQIFLKKLKEAGASSEAVEGVRRAAERFERMVEVHVGDRTTLELVLDGMAPGSTDRLEVSRKLAFRGNSGIWGVQARTRLALNVLIPNADNPGSLDMATVRGYVGFRRLRPSVRWPLFQVREWSTGDDQMMTRPSWTPLEGDEDGGVAGANILESFSSANLPDIRAEDTPEGTDIVLMPGPIGNFGAIDCFQGEMMRSAVSRYRNGGDNVGEFGAAISVPVETLVMDVIAHEDLAFALEARVLVLGRVTPKGQPTGDERDISALPIVDEVRELAGRPPALATPRIPHYPRMFDLICARLGCEAKRMRAVRLEMKYPPLGSTVVLRFELPERASKR